MADKDALVRSYAEALFRVAEAEGELDAVERQLFAFAELLERETRVRDALADPALPSENKKELIADTLGERANPLAVNLLGFLIELGRAREVGRIVEALAEVVGGDARARGRRGPHARSRSTRPGPRSWPTRSPRPRVARSRSGSSSTPSVLGGVRGQGR